MESALPRTILVGTTEGLFAFGRDERLALESLAGRVITAITHEDRSGNGDAPALRLLVDGRALWRSREDGALTEEMSIPGTEATCLAVAGADVWIGTEGAHLWRFRDGELREVPAFEHVEGRGAWYTPWGDPADIRSLSAAGDGAIYVNVHVGGVVRSLDRGATWSATLDIEADVHQVLAHPTRRGIVLAAAAVGLGVSTDQGGSWTFAAKGLHATYLRAVAVAGDTVLVTAATGPSGRRAAIYRTHLADQIELERCEAGLPKWFTSNIDTGCLAARGKLAAFGTDEGSVFASTDEGTTWESIAKGLPAIRSVVIV